MTTPIKDVWAVKDIPKQCDICSETRYGDSHQKHGVYRVVVRLFECGRKIAFYSKREVNHWNCYYDLCSNATKVVERLHQAQKEQDHAQV